MKRINKKEGISILSMFKMPTVQIISLEDLENEYNFTEGVSVRLSPKENKGINVFLPSIHNCKNINEIKDFIEKYSIKYDYFIHKTVKPEVIGSASRIENYNQSTLVMETYKDFKDRNEGIMKNRLQIPAYGERFIISDLKLQKKDPEDLKQFFGVLKELRKLPFLSYDIEYVIENGKIIFTDLTVEKTIKQTYDNEIYER